MTIKAVNGIPTSPHKEFIKNSSFCHAHSYTLVRPAKQAVGSLQKCNTLGRKEPHVSALEQAKALFSDHDPQESLQYKQCSNERTITLKRLKRSLSQRFSTPWTSKATSVQSNETNSNIEQDSWTKTLRRSVRKTVGTVLINTKGIDKYLEEAKTSFQNLDCEKAKKNFKLLEKQDESSSSTINLYLAAIYLLENKGAEARRHLKKRESSYLNLVMANHAEFLIEAKQGKFPQCEFYNIKDNFSKDEKIVACALFKAATSIEPASGN